MNLSSATSSGGPGDIIRVIFFDFRKLLQSFSNSWVGKGSLIHYPSPDFPFHSRILTASFYWLYKVVVRVCKHKLCVFYTSV